jgi:putative iron-dependent peroxidase
VVAAGPSGYLSSMNHQPGILADVPAASRYLTFQRLPGADPRAALQRLASQPLGEGVVVGLGASLVTALGASVAGLREPPSYSAEVVVPATPAALWCWLRGEDRGELLQRGRALVTALAEAFEPSQVVDGFRYREGRDLTGYVDGTENPKGDDALAAAFVAGAGAGLDGSSFVAVQRWQHDLARFERNSPEERDAIIGRRLSDDEELEDAPASAHVKRTAQESFSPEAFVLRRSMPWADQERHGLVFVAFGRSFDAFEAQLRRMMGVEDGITDSLFRFTRPLSTSFFWCPPATDGRLDLRAVGL